jgi:hypothetical protein
LGEVVKYKPRNEEAYDSLADSKYVGKMKASRNAGFQQDLKAGSAEHPVVMFGDAFPAERLFAFAA